MQQPKAEKPEQYGVTGHKAVQHPQHQLAVAQQRDSRTGIVARIQQRQAVQSSPPTNIGTAKCSNGRRTALPNSRPPCRFIMRYDPKHTTANDTTSSASAHADAISVR